LLSKIARVHRETFNHNLYIYSELYVEVR